MVAYTAGDGISILVTGNYVTLGIPHGRDWKGFYGLIDHLKHSLMPGSVDVTVDFDAAYLFPACDDFVEYDEGYSTTASEIAASISGLGPRMHRLDIGGLVEDIPDFVLVGPGQIIMPTPREVWSIANMHYKNMSRKELNNILSWVTMVYAGVIEEYLNVYEAAITKHVEDIGKIQVVRV